MLFRLANNDCDAIRFAGGAMSHKRYRVEIKSVFRIHTVVSRVPFKLKQNGKQRAPMHPSHWPELFRR
jgi:hypothetical protein